MSSTRYADPGSPLSQERFRSDPAFNAVRPISGTAVAALCELLTDPADRQLVLFLQGLSLRDGGADRLAQDMVAMIPDLIRYKVDAEEDLPEFLIRLCIDPEGVFEGELAPECLSSNGSGKLWAPGFENMKQVKGALIEFKRRYEDRVRKQFYLTEIGRQIWKQLDYALETKRMIVIEGREGRNKTEAVQAWYNCHLGESRFVDLKGTSNKTAHFRAFAKGYGVGHGEAHTLSRMQANVEWVLEVSRLMPVIDEAHFSFSQGPRMRTRPEMLDWIDTALCNPPMAVALITTPHFMTCIQKAVDQVGWNYRQFARRCKRYWRLPAKNSPRDIEGVIRHLLPGVDRKTVEMIVSYETMNKKDLSAVGDVVHEAKLLANEEGSQKVTFDHVDRAIREVLLLSDLPWAELRKSLEDKKCRKNRHTGVDLSGAETTAEAAEDLNRPVNSRLSNARDIGNQISSRSTSSELIGAPA